MRRQMDNETETMPIQGVYRAMSGNGNEIGNCGFLWNAAAIRLLSFIPC